MSGLDRLNSARNPNVQRNVNMSMRVQVISNIVVLSGIIGTIFGIGTANISRDWRLIVALSVPGVVLLLACNGIPILYRRQFIQRHAISEQNQGDSSSSRLVEVQVEEVSNEVNLQSMQRQDVLPSIPCPLVTENRAQIIGEQQVMETQTTQQITQSSSQIHDNKFAKLVLGNKRSDVAFTIMGFLDLVEVLHLAQLNMGFKKTTEYYFLREVGYLSNEMTREGRSLMKYLRPSIQRKDIHSLEVAPMVISSCYCIAKSVADNKRTIPQLMRMFVWISTDSHPGLVERLFDKALHSKNIDIMQFLLGRGVNAIHSEKVAEALVAAAATNYDENDDNFLSLLLNFKFSEAQRERAVLKAIDARKLTNLQILLNSGPISDECRGEGVVAVAQAGDAAYDENWRSVLPYFSISALKILLDSGSISDKHRGRALTRSLGSEAAINTLLSLDDRKREIASTALSLPRGVLDIIHAYASSIPKNDRIEAARIASQSHLVNLENLKKILDIHSTDEGSEESGMLMHQQITIVNNIPNDIGASIIRNVIKRAGAKNIIPRILNSMERLSEEQRGNLVNYIAFVYQFDSLSQYIKEFLSYLLNLGIPEGWRESAIHHAAHGSTELLALLLDVPLREKARGRAVRDACAYGAKESLDFLLNGTLPGCGTISEEYQNKAIQALLTYGSNQHPQKWNVVAECLKILLTIGPISKEAHGNALKIAQTSDVPEEIMSMINSAIHT